MPAEGKIQRQNKRLISDTNYYVWRGRARKVNIPPELFDKLWSEGVTIGPEALEEIKDEIRSQERQKHGQ